MAVRRRGKKWQYDFYDSNNERIRGIISPAGIDPEKVTKAQAIQYETILKAKLLQGLQLPNTKKDILFEILVDRYLTWCDINHKRNDRDHTACKNLLDHFGGYKTSKITLWALEGYKKKRKEQGRAPRTINIELSALRLMFKKGVEWNIVNQNPISGLEPKKHFLKEVQKQIRVLDSEEFNLLYQSANQYFKPVLAFAYCTGCRLSEIKFLKWENVNFKNEKVLIKDTKNRIEREVDLNSVTYNLLRELNDLRSKSHDDSEYVFRYKYLKKFTKSTWDNSWRNTLKASGIKHCTFHDLRHSFISNLIVNEGVDFETVMSLSGHKSLAMLKRYTHTHGKAKKEAVKKLDKYMEFGDSGHKLVTIPQVPNIRSFN